MSSWKPRLAGCLSLLAVLIGATGAGASVLTLEEALGRTLRFDRSLQAADRSVLEAEALAAQARQRPATALDLEWENLAADSGALGLGSSELTASLRRAFELGGKRDLRVRTASLAAGLARRDRAAAEADLKLGLTRAYVAAWLARELADLAAQKRGLAAEMLEAESRRQEAGAASAADVVRARVGLAQADLETALMALDAAAAAGRLAGYWGETELGRDRLELPGSALGDPQPADASLLRRTNPRLAGLAETAGVHRAEADLLRAEGRPDLDLAVGLRSDLGSGGKSLVLGVGVPLPAGDRNAGAVVAARHAAEAADLLAEAAVTAVAAELSALARERERAGLEIASLETEILPLAHRAYRETEEGHKRGLLGLTDVLETRRTLFDLRARQLQARADQALAAAAIVHLSGEGQP